MACCNVITITNQKGSVYYHEGNIFRPFDIHGKDVGRVKGAIRRFLIKFKDVIKEDRSKPGYKTLTQLFDEQLGENA